MPRDPNPHLLVSQQTAAGYHLGRVQVHYWLVRPGGGTPMKLRQDRIPDEVRNTAGPMRLMRLSGISDTTAMRYVITAHP
jgi:hypothetical protein